MAQQSRPKIDILLNLVPDSPTTVLQTLSTQPALASARDTHGYSLLHAASSYSQLELLRTLIQTYNVSPNIKDEDSETPLFYAENVEVAKALVEFGVDMCLKNAEGMTAEEKIEGEAEFPLVSNFLRQAAAGGEGAEVTPKVPKGMKVSVGTMQEPEGEAPDPEFRRRIEELAEREDFQGEDGQRQLRELIVDAVSELRDGANEDGRETSRRRVGD